MKPKPTPAEWLEAYERHEVKHYETLWRQALAAADLLEEARDLLEDIAENHPPMRTER